VLDVLLGPVDSRQVAAHCNHLGHVYALYPFLSDAPEELAGPLLVGLPRDAEINSLLATRHLPKNPTVEQVLDDELFAFRYEELVVRDARQLD